jgi:hypothetical protein
MTLSDGSYHYYVNNIGRPMLVEVMANYIAEVGEEGWRPIASYTGKFVPLIEAVPVTTAAKEEPSE